MTRSTLSFRNLLLAALVLAFLGACTRVPPVETVALTVTVDGSGSGTVTSDPAGIDVTSGEAPGILEVTVGETVTLTASAAAGSTFAGWTGDCSGTDPCVLDVTAAASVTATFALLPEDANTLTVTVDGDGTGTVTSVPAGIDVTSGDAPSSQEFAEGTSVTLTAIAAAGSTFAGWTGDCTGTDPCVLAMNADANVTATFNLDSPDLVTLTVDVIAGGASVGSVTSVPAGIDVASGDAPDTHDFTLNTVVTLTASATSGAFFGWVGGGCDSVTTTTCDVTMDMAKGVTAAFNEISSLTVRVGARTDDAMEFLGDSTAGATYTPPIWREGWVWVEDSGFIDLGWAPFHNLTESAFRFPGVTVPAGAIVTSAVFQVTARTAQSGFPTTGVMSLTVEGEKSTNANGFVQPAASDTPFDVTLRPRTDANVVWDIVDDWADGQVHTAPAATAILQEVIDQAGWESGNAVTLFLKGGTLDTYRRVYSFHSGAPDTRHPTLLIEYVVMPTLP